MKKLVLLIALVMLSFKAYSQQDTTKVILPTPLAKLVYKDLIKYDACVQEVKLLETKIDKLNQKDKEKDKIISILEEKENNYQSILIQKEGQYKVLENTLNQVKKDIKKQKFNKFLWKVGTFLGVFTTSYLIITK